jgi:hypothetical protein
VIKRIFAIAGDILSYILDIKLFEVPRLIGYLAITAVFGYCAALMLIGFPCSIFQDITKKKINNDIENKITRIVAICFVIVFWTMLLYHLSNK